MGGIIATIDWSPLFISVKTSILATIISFFIGIYAARLVMKASNTMKWVVDAVLTLPLVLPPTVAGFFLLLLFSLRRPFGAWLYAEWGIKVVLTWPGCVIAATVIAFPLMYRNARAAFEQVDVNLIYAGKTLGLSESKIFWKIIMPTAAPGVASGTVLAFARALGEYGATSMLAGNIKGKTQTISIAIASEVAAGNFDTAGFWVVVIMAFSFAVVVAMNVVAHLSAKNIRRWY